MPLETVRRLADMPVAGLVELLLGTQLTLADRQVHLSESVTGLPTEVRSALAEVRAELTQRPFTAPSHRE